MKVFLYHIVVFFVDERGILLVARFCHFGCNVGDMVCADLPRGAFQRIDLYHAAAPIFLVFMIEYRLQFFC